MNNFDANKYIFSRGIDQYFIGVTNAYRFTARFFKEVFKKPFHLREVIHQCFEVGLKSLVLISLTGFIVGIVFTKQSRPSLE
jgi:phospholipid/cholesterol/gamma-HCH transport system permease protein